MITAQEVLEEARSWIGVPFHHQGRSRAGLDCVGLLVVIRRALGLPVEDKDGYDRLPHAGDLGKELARQMVKMPMQSVLMPADILEIAIKDEPHHVAIYTDKNSIIHAISGRKHGNNRVLEHRFLTPWPNRVRGHYRMPELI